MPSQKAEYIIRIGHADRYRHLHYNNALTFAENDLKSNWEYYKKRFLEEE
jgi:hypothetical protein